MDAEIKITGDVQALRLQPGDKVVIHCDQRLTVDQRELLRNYAAASLSMPPASVLVLDACLKLGVVRPE